MRRTLSLAVMVLLATTPTAATQNTPASTLGPCSAGPVYARGDRGVRPPKPVTIVKPNRPDAEGRTAQLGVIIFEGVIDVNGRVCDLRLVRDVKFTPPFPEWTDALRQAIIQSRYEPAMRDGKPVKYRMTVTSTVDI